jgi:hypothetical protein
MANSLRLFHLSSILGNILRRIGQEVYKQPGFKISVRVLCIRFRQLQIMLDHFKRAMTQDHLQSKKYRHHCGETQLQMYA